MFAFRKRMRFGFGVLLWLAFALLVSCLCLGAAFKRTQNRMPKQNVTPLTGQSSKTVHEPTDALAPSETLSADADGDGFPDGAELSTFADRENFRQAFSSIAEIQFYRLSDQWNPEQRDCAGLVRFAWREARRRHDRSWFQKMGPGYDAIAPSSGLNTNPPGEKLFRINFGAFKQNDISEGRFSEFADARTLKNFNCTFIGRDRQLAQRGDLLFYYQPWVQKFPYHVMIFLGESPVVGGPSRDWVVYHTGASATDQGTVKKVELSVLDHHPNKRWRPVEDNPNFLGFYRLKILD